MPENRPELKVLDLFSGIWSADLVLVLSAPAILKQPHFARLTHFARRFLRSTGPTYHYTTT